MELFKFQGLNTTREKHVYLGRLPQNLHVLAFLGAHVLAQQLEQLRNTAGAVGAGEA